MPFDHTSACAMMWFIRESAAALISAADLLGSAPARKRCERLIADCLEAPVATRRLEKEARWLLGLLALDAVNNPDSIEAACFARILPEDPVVADICALTDGLAAALSETRHGILAA